MRCSHDNVPLCIDSMLSGVVIRGTITRAQPHYRDSSIPLRNIRSSFTTDRHVYQNKLTGQRGLFQRSHIFFQLLPARGVDWFDHVSSRLSIPQNSNDDGLAVMVKHNFLRGTPLDRTSKLCVCAFCLLLTGPFRACRRSTS